MRILIFTLCRRFGYCAFEKLFASKRSGPQKTQLSYIFPEIPTFLEKIPHFQGPSHIPTFLSKFWLDTVYRQKHISTALKPQCSATGEFNFYSFDFSQVRMAGGAEEESLRAKRAGHRKQKIPTFSVHSYFFFEFLLYSYFSGLRI
jgi:hypothetical protein